jgi:hypothetical protein
VFVSIAVEVIEHLKQHRQLVSFQTAISIAIEPLQSVFREIFVAEGCLEFRRRPEREAIGKLLHKRRTMQGFHHITPRIERSKQSRSALQEKYQPAPNKRKLR